MYCVKSQPAIIAACAEPTAKSEITSEVIAVTRSCVLMMLDPSC